MTVGDLIKILSKIDKNKTMKLGGFIKNYAVDHREGKLLEDFEYAYRSEFAIEERSSEVVFY